MPGRPPSCSPGADQRVIRVGWFTPEIDPHKLLLSYGTGRWGLLVVPPETCETAAINTSRRPAPSRREGRRAPVRSPTVGERRDHRDAGRGRFPPLMSTIGELGAFLARETAAAAPAMATPPADTGRTGKSLRPADAAPDTAA